MSTVSMSPNRYGNHDGFYLAVYAHEYGHHVQELSGISSEEWNQRVAAGVDSPVGLELSRRSELQAQCFSGMFLGSRRGARSPSTNSILPGTTNIGAMGNGPSVTMGPTSILRHGGGTARSRIGCGNAIPGCPTVQK